MNDKELLELAQRALLRALCMEGARHPDNCAAQAFADMNRHLPANHSHWKQQPECTCWRRDAAVFLKGYQP